ncbi:MAG: antibiotic biosynthesis monooxygenase [Deltaproteobacteria bacterium]|nr:antibiotic biosynthesis monooxygenase [Deltaproteobacteria bacterium]
MFIAMIAIQIIPDNTEKFEKWFSRTNKEFAGHKGLINRRLLKSPDSGRYVILVEHESHETFIAGSSYPDHIKANEQLPPMLAGEPVPQFYEVII